MNWPLLLVIFIWLIMTFGGNVSAKTRWPFVDRQHKKAAIPTHRTAMGRLMLFNINTMTAQGQLLTFLKLLFFMQTPRLTSHLFTITSLATVINTAVRLGFSYTKSMLRMSNSLVNVPVLSLRLGEPVAMTTEVIINPHNLKIMGWRCLPNDGGEELILLTEDVREETPKGLAVNDIDALVDMEDLVRHREVLEIRFKLIEKPVRTKRQKIGKVSDYTYNDGMFIQKLYVEKSLMKVWSSEDTIVIDRAQILEITDKFILVKDTEVLAEEREMSIAPEAATT